jgi:hypothetical protein
VKRYYFFRFVSRPCKKKSVSEFFSFRFKKNLVSLFRLASIFLFRNCICTGKAGLDLSSVSSIFYNLSRNFWAVTLKFLVWVQYTNLTKWSFFYFRTVFRSVSVSSQVRIAESRPNPRIKFFLPQYLVIERWCLFKIRDIPTAEFFQVLQFSRFFRNGWEFLSNLNLEIWNVEETLFYFIFVSFLSFHWNFVSVSQEFRFVRCHFLSFRFRNFSVSFHKPC